MSVALALALAQGLALDLDWLVAVSPQGSDA